MDECAECTRNSTKNQHQQTRSRRRLRSGSRWTLLAVLVVMSSTTLFPLATATGCSHHEYWDMDVNDCILCTKCTSIQIVIRPCQPHLDTVCQSIKSIDIDHHHHRSMSMEITPPVEQEQELLLWDWRLVMLILAIIACLLFFIVTAVIFVIYVRQWRKIKKEFDTDIEQLSQQLMARLAVPPSDTATIFIDDPTTRNHRLGPRQIEVRCIYLDDIIAGKECLKDQQGSLRVSNSPAGNVYIEDNEKRHVIVGPKHV